MLMNLTTTVTQTKNAAGNRITADIARRALLVTLKISTWTGSVTDKKVTKEIRDKYANGKNAGRYVKQAMIHPKLKKIIQLGGEIRVYHRLRTLPWEERGARILASSLYQSYHEDMGRMARARETLVLEMAEDWDNIIRAQQTRLNLLFNEADYPSSKEFIKAFGYTVTPLPFPTKEDFRLDLGQENIDRLKAGVEKGVLERMEAANRDLWRKLYQPIKHLAERWGQPDAKVFDTAIDNIVEIAGILPSLNLTGDTELEQLNREILEKLKGITAEDARKNPIIKAKAAKAAQGVVNKMAQYMAAFPSEESQDEED